MTTCECGLPVHGRGGVCRRCRERFRRAHALAISLELIRATRVKLQEMAAAARAEADALEREANLILFAAEMADLA